MCNEVIYKLKALISENINISNEYYLVRILNLQIYLLFFFKSTLFFCQCTAWYWGRDLNELCIRPMAY